MTLHLLGKKSWHVFNDDNRQRVRADEAKHAAEEEAKKKKIVAIEAEARLDTLKRLAALTGRATTAHTGTYTAETDGEPDHVNLFLAAEEEAEEAAAVKSEGAAAASAAKRGRKSTVGNAGNAEHEAERKLAEEKERRRAGIQDWKLGDGAAETAKYKPWYHYRSGVDAPPTDLFGRPLAPEAAAELRRRDEQRKSSQDPLGAVRAQVTATRVHNVLSDVQHQHQHQQ
jgi:hypothetical protein